MNPPSTNEKTTLTLFQPDAIHAATQRAAQGDAALKPALDALTRNAQAALTQGPWSVMDKALTPPSGDKHDYMSLGSYWWPDPEKPDGLPYIRRDGELNPEGTRFDISARSNMTSSVATLALAYRFTGEKRFADRAALLLRTWFLDPATRMNPHLKYAQSIPGKCDGRGIGLIDTHGLIDILDPVTMLVGSGAWSADDHAQFRTWIAQYLTWFLESDLGQDESKQKNNHGTWYDAQVVAFACFVDKPAIAQQTLRKQTLLRIAEQFDPDGSQPRELSRTLSHTYATMNLLAWCYLARMAERFDIDLWRHETPDGRSLHKAIQWMAQHGTGVRNWTRQQILPPKYDSLASMLLCARPAYPDDAAISNALRELGSAGVDTPSLRANLIYASAKLA